MSGCMKASGSLRSEPVMVTRFPQAQEPHLSRAEGTYAIIIAPTRELCLQICDVLTLMLRRFIWLVSPGLLSPSLLPSASQQHQHSLAAFHRLLQWYMPRQLGFGLAVLCKHPRPSHPAQLYLQHAATLTAQPGRIGRQMQDHHHVAWLLQVSNSVLDDKQEAGVNMCSEPLHPCCRSVTASWAATRRALNHCALAAGQQQHPGWQPDGLPAGCSHTKTLHPGLSRCRSAAASWVARPATRRRHACVRESRCWWPAQGACRTTSRRRPPSAPTSCGGWCWMRQTGCWISAFRKR